MNVEFTPEQQMFVRLAIESGRFDRPEDAAQEAFSLWVEHERAKSRRLSSQENAQAAAARIRELRKGNFLPEGVTIRDLIEEGRD
jgi:Arc/MetJ-type ribon-helix-helix transcriptional regulator